MRPDGSIQDPYRNFIAISRYARWRDDDLRRETWEETVGRYIAFFREHLSTNFGYDAQAPIFATMFDAILNHEVMPSMRALMTAGEALKRSNIAGYNCSFIAVNAPEAFSEAMYILLNGTGVGFSVERRHVEKLNSVPEEFVPGPMLIVPDSKEGWAETFRLVLKNLYMGQIPSWDTGLVRPAGSRLRTFGGRASGPAPLAELLTFTVETFRKAAGRRLTPLECHDLMCKIGDIVVVGGVRRSALISLSDLGDHDMAKAKNGNWWEFAGHRALANNSASYMQKPSVTQFLREWRNLIESQSGERGIFNLNGARAHADYHGRDGDLIEGTNPCGEILLRDQEFCNLTEVVVRPEDTANVLAQKVRLAAILGTWQSTLTDFHHIREGWKENCDEERLLGVSLTGIYGNRLLNNPMDVRMPARLERLRSVAHAANHHEARALGINPSAAVTCVKPSGTVSQLTGVSSGIHPWHSDYYIRSVRGDNKDPLTQMMKDAGIPHEPDVRRPDDHTVFYFPVKAPEGAITRQHVSAIEHLALWSIYRKHWTDHNPSITVNVRDDEWLEVGSWVYSNWDKVGGIAFLPYTEHVYAQAPYQECDEVTYKEFADRMPEEIRWADLGIYELMDSTIGGQELACVAGSGSCEVVDIAT